MIVLHILFLGSPHGKLKLLYGLYVLEHEELSDGRLSDRASVDGFMLPRPLLDESAVRCRNVRAQRTSKLLYGVAQR